jgi:hypothetical protein
VVLNGTRITHAEGGAASALAGSAFSYQGQLTDGDAAVNGTCDFQFTLYDAASEGAQVGESVEKAGIAVEQGLFSTELDFGTAVFDGAARWLSVAVRCPAGGNGDFTALSPRQPLSATPYAIYANSAATALNLSWQNLSDVPQGLNDGDNDTLASLDCAADQVPAWNGEAWGCAVMQGEVGPAGPKGETGATGAAGKDGISPAQVVWVAKSGADFTTVVDALASITDASADKRYLIKIAPGTYEGYIDLKSFVDLEGSGEGVTILRAFGSDENPSLGGSSATMRAAGDMTVEVRFLTVESVAHQADYGTGIHSFNVGVGLVRLTHVIATASGAFLRNSGVWNAAAPVLMTHVTASGSGGEAAAGVTNLYDAPIIMEHVTALASGGPSHYGVVNVFGGSPLIRNAAISGDTGSILNSGQKGWPTPASARVANTMLTGAVGGANFTCLGVYNDSFVALDTSCTP